MATYIKIRRAWNAGHCWRSRDELLGDVLLWTPSHGRAKSGRPARTDIQQLCADTGCSPEDQPKAMDDREGWRERERVRNIRADIMTRWWWWWWYISFFNRKSAIHLNKESNGSFWSISSRHLFNFGIKSSIFFLTIYFVTECISSLKNDSIQFWLDKVVPLSDEYRAWKCLIE